MPGKGPIHTYIHTYIHFKIVSYRVWISSIAQVHKAKLLDGRIVAVKVKRPGIEGKLLGDIQALHLYMHY